MPIDNVSILCPCAFSCSNNFTCIDVFRNIEATPAGCTIGVAGGFNETQSFGNLTAGQVINDSVQYSCTPAGTYAFNVTANSTINDLSDNQSISISAGGGGGLTVEEHDWLEAVYNCQILGTGCSNTFYCKTAAAIWNNNISDTYYSAASDSCEMYKEIDNNR